MPPRTRSRVVDDRYVRWLPGIAVGLAWLTHGLAYMAASPDPHNREALLNSTGHTYLGSLAPVLTAALLVSIAAFLIDRLTHVRRSTSARRNDAYRAIAVRLAALQIVAFLMAEVTERLVHGGSLGDLLQPAVAIGLVLQPFVAVIAARFLSRVETFLERWIERGPFSGVRRPASFAQPNRLDWVKRPLPAVGESTLRAPPYGA
jgi:hypothetical protein